MSNRLHGKGSIVPSDYEHVLFYNLATNWEGWFIPSFRVNCGAEVVWNDDGTFTQRKHSPSGDCCIVGLHEAGAKFAERGTTGKCTVCGSRFVYGEVWRHKPTGELIHIGHICSKKYGLLADYDEFELEYEKYRRRTAVELEKRRNREQQAEFLAQHDGLAEAFKTEHPIVQNIYSQFLRRCSISEKQVGLVFKLQREANSPKEEEKYVDAPEGRKTFEGIVVGRKTVEGHFGTKDKMTVKIEEEQGIWLAYGTVPQSMYGEEGGIRGRKVRITGTLSRGRDRHFAFFKRPKGEVLSEAQE